MFTRDWRDDVAEDIHAMQNARSWSAVESIRRGMQGLGRWTGEAQRAYAQACARWGHQPTDLEQETRTSLTAGEG